MALWRVQYEDLFARAHIHIERADRRVRYGCDARANKSSYCREMYAINVIYYDPPYPPLDLLFQLVKPCDLPLFFNC